MTAQLDALPNLLRLGLMEMVENKHVFSITSYPDAKGAVKPKHSEQTWFPSALSPVIQTLEARVSKRKQNCKGFKFRIG
jgi:hypothetical protein